MNYQLLREGANLLAKVCAETESSSPMISVSRFGVRFYDDYDFDNFVKASGFESLVEITYEKPIMKGYVRFTKSLTVNGLTFKSTVEEPDDAKIV